MCEPERVTEPLTRRGRSGSLVWIHRAAQGMEYTACGDGKRHGVCGMRGTLNSSEIMEGTQLMKGIHN